MNMRVAGVAAGLLIASSASTCASWSNHKSERLPDGTIRLECKTSLPHCLDFAEVLCGGTRYEVLRATDDHDYYGPAGIAETETRASTAVFKCGPRGRPLFGGTAPPSPSQPTDAGLDGPPG